MDMAVKATKTLLIVLSLFSFIAMSTETTYSHSGRTDSSGGHNCYVGSCAGTYHYHNGGGYSPPSDYEQGAAAGRAFAYGDNRPNIESSAQVEGNHEGDKDGQTGYTSTPTRDDSVEHCSPQRRFTGGDPSQSYKNGFMSTFTPACIEIYKSKFDTAYKSANTLALKSYEEKQAKELAVKEEQKKAEDVKNRNTFLLLSGVVGSGIAGSAMLNSYRKAHTK